jgi:hypothetical protein
MLLLVLALTAQSPAPAGALIEERPKVLVLDFKDDGVGAAEVSIIHDSLTAHLSKDTRVVVVSSEDMRRTLDVEAQKRAAGCTEGDASCLAEIAGALGTRFLVYGNAGKLGELVVVNISLYDADKQTSVGRETVEAPRVEALLDPLRAASDRLLTPLVGAPPAGPSPMFWGGAVVGVLGLGGVVTGVAIGLANENAVNEKPDFVDKQSAKDAAVSGWTVAAVSGGAFALGAVLAVAGLALE